MENKVINDEVNEKELQKALERFNIPDLKTLEEEKEADEVERWLASIAKQLEIEEQQKNVGKKL